MSCSSFPPHLLALPPKKPTRVRIPGFPGNFTGATKADFLRLNMAIPPSSSRSPSILGLLGGDIAGFPNGRRVFDDIVTIELQAIAGVTIPLVDPSFTPDAAAGVITDFGPPPQIPAGVRFEKQFPYLGEPFGGYESRPHPGA